jgi:type III secretion protein J
MRSLGSYSTLLLLLLLTGCKIDLYKGLNEQEANQMLALLMINRISAQKVDEPGGLLKLKVVKADFVNAVEILRQHGYPKRQFYSVNDLFPANQLVTSPLQEQAKLTYLKEQRLEQLISAMEGVVSASISIADPPQAENRREVIRPSASVLVKYSPETNMAHFINQIKSLVHNSMPGLSYEAITVVLQATNYRFLQQQIPEISPVKSLTTSGTVTEVSTPLSPWFKRPPLAGILAWSSANPLWCLLGTAWLILLLMGGYWLSRRHTAAGYANH